MANSSSSSTSESMSTPRTMPNCVVSIIADDDSDADTLKDCSGHYDDPSPTYHQQQHNSNHHPHFYHHQHSYDYSTSPSRSRPPMIKHIASSSSVCTMDTETVANCLSTTGGGSSTQLNGASSSRTTGDRKMTLGGRPYSGSTSGGSQTGCAPILLSVPGAGGANGSQPRRRHSWICGWVQDFILFLAFFSKKFWLVFNN